MEMKDLWKKDSGSMRSWLQLSLQMMSKLECPDVSSLQNLNAAGSSRTYCYIATNYQAQQVLILERGVPCIQMRSKYKEEATKPLAPQSRLETHFFLALTPWLGQVLQSANICLHNYV